MGLMIIGRYIFQMISAGIVTATIGVAFNTPKRSLFHIFWLGGLSWGAYLFAKEELSYSSVQATFIACFIIVFIAQLLSRKLKIPVTVFLLSDFIIYVPGAGIYLTVYNFILNNSEEVWRNLSSTFQVSAVIAMAVISVEMLFYIFTHLKRIRVPGKLQGRFSRRR